jgi:hypothetical protein
MVLGDEGTRRQYLFDLEQLGAFVASHEADLMTALRAIHAHLENRDDCPALMQEVARAVIASRGMPPLPY